jgi:hypothetical protein
MAAAAGAAEDVLLEPGLGVELEQAVRKTTAMAHRKQPANDRDGSPVAALLWKAIPLMPLAPMFYE